MGLFDTLHITDVARWAKGARGSTALHCTALTVAYELDGRSFHALDGGPESTFSEAISFELFFDTQTELETKWAALTADGGQESQCGWLKDRFGVSWQLIPNDGAAGPCRQCWA